jgi:hypothetical protein
MRKTDSSSGLETLLDLHRETAEIGGGWWVTFRVTQVACSEGRPHGLQYSLTLHSPGGSRVFGYDNAHKMKKEKKFQKVPLEYDHVHIRDKVCYYKFTSPEQLLVDFWNDVELILKEEGVP